VLTDTHEKHLEVLDQVLARLHKNHLKINLEKCICGNKEVSYLGFTLTPDGIKPGKNKLEAIKDEKLLSDIKTSGVHSGAVKLLPDTHQVFFTHRGTTFPTHLKGFGVQIGHSSSTSLTSLLCSAETTHLGTGNGFSQG
jgi:hypothetical protein